jgi:hypothetical protein
LTRGHIWPCVHIPRVQVATYIYTRVQVAACKKYTRPLVFHAQPAMLSSKQVASWPRSYSNRYCRHAANCSFFCSDCEYQFLFIFIFCNFLDYFLNATMCNIFDFWCVVKNDTCKSKDLLNSFM